MKVNIGKFPRKAERRINVNIERFDTWSLDHTLAYIIFPALLQLKATAHGVPNEFASQAGGDDNSNSQLSFDFYKETHQEAFDECVKKWEETLDKMIWAFYQILIDDDSKYHHGKPEYDWAPTNKQFANPITGKMEDTFQMVDKNPEGHWTDFEGLRLRDERIQEGLELFGKYYRNLWD